MARHWNPIMMNAVLFGRIAHAARESRHARPDRRAAAAPGAHLHPLPPRRRRARRGRKNADGRDQRAAGPSRHHLQPSSARRRAGLVHGARRGRSRRAAGQFHRGGKGRGRRARHGRQGDRDAVALLGRAVPEELRPPRPARKGLQGLHRARRQRQRQRQQCRHRRDPRASRGERQAPRFPDLRRLPAGGFHGQDAGGRSRPPGAGLEAGARPRARRSRRAAGADRGGGRQFCARALGLALLRRKAAPDQRQFRRRRDKALSRARSHDRCRLRLRHPPVRHHLRRAQGHPGLASRRAGLGGEGRQRQAQGAVLRRLLCPAVKTLRRLDDLAARPAEARRRSRAADHQCLQFRQGRRRPALAAVAR